MVHFPFYRKNRIMKPIKVLELSTDLVSEIGTELSKKLEYKYPDKLENDIRKYLAGLKPKT